MNNHKYQIIRTKSKTSHKLKFFIDDIDHSASLKETQQKIIDTIKIDYDTFIDTVCISQNKASSFMEKSAKERKEVFSQILNLEDYNNLEQFTKNLRKTLVTEYETTQAELNSIKSKVLLKEEYLDKLSSYTNQLQQIDIKSIQLELESIQALKSKIDTIKSKNQLILSQRDQLQKMIKRYESLIDKDEKELSSITIDDSSNLEKDLKEKTIVTEELNNSIQELKSLIAGNKIKESFLRKELKQLKDKKQNIVNYDKAVCDFCGNVLTEEYKQSYVDSLNVQGKKLFTKLKQLLASIEETEEKVREKEKIYVLMKKEIDDINKLKQSIVINQNRIDTLNENIKRNNQELIQLKKDLAINELEEIVEINEDEDINKKIFMLKDNLNQRMEEKNLYTSKIAILKDRLEQIEQYEEQTLILEKELKEKALILEDYKSLINAFSKQGIQSFIIENTLPEIEEEINNLLEELTNEKISISFAVQKETKSKTVIDTLDIIVNDSNINRKYETFSGGEKFRIDFACHVGLSRFLAKRANASIDLFILDENLGSQDETAKEIFVQYITKLNNYFKQILIITHINDIKEAFTNKILVKKDENGSHIEIL